MFRNCKVCRIQFEPERNGNAEFCSTKCRVRWHRHRKGVGGRLERFHVHPAYQEPTFRVTPSIDGVTNGVGRDVPAAPPKLGAARVTRKSKPRPASRINAARAEENIVREVALAREVPLANR